jgi:multidrug efflux pump subunit AcrB
VNDVGARRSDGEPRRGILGWFVDNKVAANLVMLFLVVGGLLSIPNLEQEVFPEVTLPVVTVQVPYPGASPEEVEQGVLLAIEEAVRGLDGVEEVRSVAVEGVGVVSVELLLSADQQQLLNDIDSAVGRIESFPEDAEEPVVSLATNRRQVVSLIYYGPASETALRELAERVRDDLLGMDRITFVELSAIRPLEISIEVPREELRRYGLTLADISRRVDAASVEIPGGEVETEGGEILLRTAARKEVGDELRDVVVVAEPDGTEVRLEDIATIEDAFRDVDQAAYFDGEPAVRVDVYRVGEETPVEVSDAVHEYVEGQELPDGVKVAIWNDQSEIFRDRVDLLLRNGYIGLLLVLAMLGLALSPRLAFWVTLGIPISFLGSLLLLPAFDVSLNVISLFAFIITLGLVVDDAIIVGEAIYYRREQGYGRREASIRGARDVARPVLFAISTTCLAFAPMLFVPGVAGKLFRNIPIVVILVLLGSLLESLLVLPSHLSERMPRPLAWVLRPFLWLMGRMGSEKVTASIDWLVRRSYIPVARRALRWRYFTVALGLALLLGAVGLWVGDRIDFTFLPKIQDEEVTATLELPVGTPTERTAEAMQRMQEAARAAAADTTDGEDLIDGVFAQLGAPAVEAERLLQSVQQGGGHVASVMIDLGPASERETTSRQFVERWREELGEVAGAEKLVFSYTTGASEGADIDLEVSHPEEERLYSVAEEIAAALEDYAGVRDVDDGYTPGKDQLDFTLTPQGRARGLSEAGLAAQVRGAFFGDEAYRIQRGRNELRVYVRLPEAQRTSLEHVEDLVLLTPQGGEVPLLEAAEVERTRAYTSIERAEGRRVVHVTANVYGEANANDVVADLQAGRVAELEAEYPRLRVAPAGEQERQAEALSSLGTGFGIALVAMFALLAAAFRSYLQPLVVLAAIPFGAVGALAGHMLLGYDLSLSSILGLVALAGVVVNDSLLLVVTINEVRESEVKLSLNEAIVRAGTRRFRPILMTSLTTFLGLAPMIFETSVQARFLIPMALSLGFGILFATFIIVMIAPCLYRILEDVKRGSARLLDFAFGPRRSRRPIES